MKYKAEKIHRVLLYSFVILGIALLYNQCSAKYVRIGAICGDGWRSSATASGACSHHHGVYEWIEKETSPRVLSDQARNIGLIVLGINFLCLPGTLLLEKIINSDKAINRKTELVTSKPKAEKKRKQSIPSIESLSYDFTNKTLKIKFVAGESYRYYNVPENVWKELQDSGDQDAYVNKHINGSYDAVAQ